MRKDEPEGLRLKWCREVRRNKQERTEVEVVQKSEEEQARKDRGGGGAKE